MIQNAGTEQRPVILEVTGVSKRFGSFQALQDVSFAVRAHSVHCLIGDNGAGKSTLVKILSGVTRPTVGSVRVDGETVVFDSPAAALKRGIATVHQELAVLPLMSIARNFFLGAEPRRGRSPFTWFDARKAETLAVQELARLGLTRIRSGRQLAGVLSGGERQSLVIARALYFGARVLILDEPTAALGVKEAANVLRLIDRARADGVGIVLITHNAGHAMAVGDEFTVLIHGKVADHFQRGERTREEVLSLMAGGAELDTLSAQLEQESGDGRPVAERALPTGR